MPHLQGEGARPLTLDVPCRRPNHPNRSCRRYSKFSLLQLACAHGHAGIARQLLEARADIDYQVPTSGDTALHMAIAVPDVECVQLLLQKGASVGLVNAKGLGVAHACCCLPPAAPLLLPLLEAKADPALATAAGYTPLALAVKANAGLAVFFLLEHGVDPLQVPP